MQIRDQDFFLVNLDTTVVLFQWLLPFFLLKPISEFLFTKKQIRDQDFFLVNLDTAVMLFQWVLHSSCQNQLLNSAHQNQHQLNGQLWIHTCKITIKRYCNHQSTRFFPLRKKNKNKSVKKDHASSKCLTGELKNCAPPAYIQVSTQYFYFLPAYICFVLRLHAQIRLRLQTLFCYFSFSCFYEVTQSKLSSPKNIQTLSHSHRFNFD